MGIELQLGQPCYEARKLECSCAWLRGFHVGPVAETWDEKIIWRDPDCPVPHELRGDVVDET